MQLTDKIADLTRKIPLPSEDKGNSILMTRPLHER